MEVRCVKSNEVVCLINSDETETIFCSFGYCLKCKKPYKEEFLSMPSGVGPSPWPIHWEGCECEDCFKI